MIIVDANLLIYIVNKDSPFHGEAKDWFETLLNSDETLGLPEVVLLGFLRIVTQARIVTHPISPQKAIGIVRRWLAEPNVRLLTGSPTSFEASLSLMREIGVAGNLSTDAHIAALALTLNAVVATVDTDFQRFSQLKTNNPIRKKS